jgi:hypothetical protein
MRRAIVPPHTTRAPNPNGSAALASGPLAVPAVTSGVGTFVEMGSMTLGMAPVSMGVLTYAVVMLPTRTSKSR